MDPDTVLNALRDELNDKLPEERYCELETMYDVCGMLVDDACKASLEHLVTIHEDVAAAKLLSAALTYIEHVSTVEAGLFAQYKIKGQHRLDLQINSQAAMTGQEVLAALLEKAASADHDRQQTRH